MEIILYENFGSSSDHENWHKLWLNNDFWITKMCKLILSPTHPNKTQMDLLNHFLHWWEPLQPYKSRINNDWTYSLILKFKSIYNFITYHYQTRCGSYTIPYANYILTWQWGNLHKEIKWFNNKWPWKISLVKFLKKFIDCTKPIETEICRNLIFADFGPSIAPAANHHPP